MASRREQKEKLKAEREAAAASAQQEASKRRRNRMLVLAIGLALAIVLVLVAISQSGDDEGGDTTGPRSQLLSGIAQKGITLGNDDAPVTIVEFADLQCPFCAQFSEEVFPDLVDRYVRNGDVRMELRLLSFIGPDSVRAAEFAAATAEQDRYFSFTDAFFANQGREGSGYVTDDFLRDVANQAGGIDVDQAFEDAGSEPSVSLLAEADSLATDEGVSSTPSFLIGSTGGRLAPLEITALELAEFEQAIEAELEGAGD